MPCVFVQVINLPPARAGRRNRNIISSESDDEEPEAPWVEVSGSVDSNSNMFINAESAGLEAPHHLHSNQTLHDNEYERDNNGSDESQSESLLQLQRGAHERCNEHNQNGENKEFDGDDQDPPLCLDPNAFGQHLANDEGKYLL